ncbi:MAG: helix-turn-helix domain-containing protein [Pirellulales bacterium]
MSESFGDRLRKEREEKGLSQSDLAEKAGLQPSAISHFELGRRMPSFDNLKRLADALSVTVDYLLGRQSSPSNAGPVVDQLFRNFEQMSADDQDRLTSFAELLAAKNKSRHEGS